MGENLLNGAGMCRKGLKNNGNGARNAVVGRWKPTMASRGRVTKGKEKRRD